MLATLYGSITNTLNSSTSNSDIHITDGNDILSNVTIDKSLKSNRQFTDFKIAGTLTYIKLLSNKMPKLQEVHFTYPKPKNTFEHERIFQCELFFDKPTNALIFDSGFLNTTVIEPNPNLLLLFEKNANEILETLTTTNITYSHLVNDILVAEVMKCNLPEIETVAKKLSLSVRNLQLYLQKEGTSYTRLTREIRKNVAEKHLKDRNISIDEISYLLGFSETSAFHRAFKNWTGITPAQFRISLINN